MSSDGTKVPTDPEGIRNPIQEGSGFVASDSLAAESLQNNGSFDANNPNAAADPQSARGATANTTDTSAAERLDPAPSRPLRDDGDETYQGGVGDVTGTARGPTYNTDTGSGSGLGSGSGSGSGTGAGYNASSGSGSGAATGSSYGASSGTSEGRTGTDTGNYERSSAGVAPTYVAVDRDSNAPDVVGGPKGRNLTEGGFDDSAPNASFNNDIGGKNDPGRLAEEAFDKSNTENAAGLGGAVPRQGSDEEGNPYSTLSGQQS